MRIAIVGVGIHPFGRTPELSGMQQGAHAARLALQDAGVEWNDMQFAVGGSYSGGNADAMCNELGLTGVQFTNILNACATGGSSLLSASKEIKSGEADIGLVVGFDKHARGAFNAQPSEYGLGSWYGEAGFMLTTQFFAAKLTRYMHDHGITTDALARVAEKAYENGALNPNAWRRTPIDLETIKHSQMVNDPLTKYMFCSPSEGGVALVVCREDHAHRYTDKPVYVRASEIRTRRFGTYEVHATSAPLEEDVSPTVYAAKAAYEAAGIGPEDVDIAQLQDTDAGAEIIHMAETGLCADGEQEKLLADGATEIHGSLPINTDGGLIANGEPIGASGLRQMHELVRQLRGEAGERQIPGSPRVGLAQVYGAPGTASATILSL